MSGRGMTILRMVARAWSAVSALVLALFFVEHLEWFADLHHLPPGRIFAAEGFHLLHPRTGRCVEVGSSGGDACGGRRSWLHTRG